MAHQLRSLLPLIILSQVSEADNSEMPLWGYRISELIDRESAGRFRLRAGTLYPLLSSLERSGLLKSEWGEADDGPRRKYFHITAKGRRVLERERESYEALLALALPARAKRLTGTRS